MSKPTTAQSLDAILDVLPTDSPVLEGELVPMGSTDLVPVANNTSMVVTADKPVVEQQLEDDFQKARKNITSMIENVEAALNSAIMLAQAGDQPRAYEVVGGMLERLVNANKELVALHKAKKDTLETTDNRSLLPTGEGSTVNIDKAVFVGRASDLLREVKRLEKANASES